MTQLEVQRLVEDLSYVAKYSDSEHWSTLAEVASELRRLHAQRDALLEALKKLDNFFETYRPEGHPVSDPHELVRAAIKAAEENT